MENHVNKVIVLSFVLLTSSCNISLVNVPVTIKELLPIGSTLRLTQILNIPADRSYMYLAHGKVPPLKNFNTVDIYQPYCMFGFSKESSQPRQIMPDTFEVTKIVEWDAYYGSLDYKNVTNSYSRTGGMTKVSTLFDDNYGPSTVMYATILSLRSDKQPDVNEIVCGHWDEQNVVEPLTLKEMEIALGDLIIINRAVHKRAI